MACMPMAALIFLAVAAESSLSRFRVVNGCDKEPIWVAHMAQRDNGPDGQNIRLQPGRHFDFATPDGLAGTRYWPKMRCDPDGNNCAIGESGGPGETCDSASGCAPPVDTKFEASFNANGEDWVDISLVDGYTLPFKFEMRGGGCSAGFGNPQTSHCPAIGASIAMTPRASTTISTTPRAKDLRIPQRSSTVQSLPWTSAQQRRTWELGQQRI